MKHMTILRSVILLINRVLTVKRLQGGLRIQRTATAQPTMTTTKAIAAIMVYSGYKKQRILAYYSQGYRAPTIARLLRREQLHASRRGICKFLHRYRGSGTIHRMPGSGLRSKATEEVRQIVE